MSYKSPLLCAIDIETSGSHMINNGIISIGYCFGTLNGKIVESNRINLELPAECSFEELCWKEFWVFHKETLTLLQKDTVSATVGINTFVDILDSYDKEHGVTIITDNPSFDIGFLNYYICKYTKRLPLNYDVNKKYRSIIDVDSFNRAVSFNKIDSTHCSDDILIRVLTVKFHKSAEELKLIKGQHLPDDDAKYIYHLAIAVNNLREELL